MIHILKYSCAFFAVVFIVSVITSCSTQAPHNGLLPFSMMEKPLSKRSATFKARKSKQSPQKMTEVVRYDAMSSTNPTDLNKARTQIQAGDVIAFYMSQKTAREYLQRGAIQKTPYMLFSYGHLALVVPNPDKDINQQTHSDLKLLQVAMRQAVNTSDGLEYLADKSWVVLRPPEGSINKVHLHQFTSEVVKKGSSSQKAYHYTAAFGLWNGYHHPVTPAQISKEYTCSTLIIAALNYSGYHLYSARRYGILDIITPRQVTESWGIKNS